MNRWAIIDRPLRGRVRHHGNVQEEIKLLDTVALVDDLPERKLKHGEVGTVVEILAPGVFEVEFSDDEGRTYAELALRDDQIIALHNQGERLKIVA